MNRYELATQACDRAWLAYRSAPEHMKSAYYALYENCQVERRAAIKAQDALETESDLERARR